MKKYLFTLCCILCITLLRAQPTMNIKPGTQVNAKNNVQVSVKTDSFANNGTYTDTSAIFNMLKASTFSGVGNTTMYNANFNFGAMLLKELVSVYNTATVAVKDTLNANNYLWIHSDIKPTANLVVNGVLTGTVQGLVPSATVDSGGCPFFTSVLSLNISGPVVLYQWQISPDSITWSTITGATNATYTATVAHTYFFRANLTTTNSSYVQSTAGKKLLFTGIYPPPIVGNFNVCVGQSTLLSDSLPPGSWTSSNTSFATVGLVTGLVSGVVAGTANISYTLTSGCGVDTMMTINPLPSAIGGTPVVCVGQTITLVDGGGGTWASSNSGLASVTPGPVGGGVVTGVVAGTPTITYTLPTTGCYVTTPVTVNPLPAPITGASSVCVGSTTTLNDATPAGAWTSTTTTVATVGTGGVVTGISSVGSPTNIKYTLGTGCFTTFPVTVNPLPTVYRVVIGGGGTGHYCAGSTGVDIQLTSSTTGVNYQLYNTGTPAGSPVAGTGSVMDFGPQTLAGPYTVIATNATTGCSKLMAGNPAVTIDPLPPVSTLTTTNGGSFCAGGSGVDIYDSLSTSGIQYQLYQAGVPLFTPLTGTTGTKLDFGAGFGLLFTNPAIYTAIAKDPATGCTSNVLGSITVNVDPLPIVYNMTGGGSYCAGGTGVHVGLSYAESGIAYQLWRNVTTLAATDTGANSGLDFGLETIFGGYTVIAKDLITGCTNNMAGTDSVKINPLPNVDTVHGGGSFCSGGTGVDVSLSGSDLGISYQLYNGLTLTGAAVAGSGAGLDFGNQTVAGAYTAVATDALTGCTNNMYSSATVSVNPLPAVFNLSAGATSYCAGGTGVDIKLSGSVSGIKYYLYNAGTLIDSMMGTGTALDYGFSTLGGTYTAVASNTTTGCAKNMTGSPSVTINTLPIVYAMTGGGGYCAGGTGVHIGLAYSDPGINYQLYKGITAIGSPIAGSSSALDFGIFTIAGAYTIVATNSVTSCTSNMSGSGVVTINPLPTLYIVKGGGSYCTGGTGLHVTLSGSDVTANYQLYNGLTPVGGLLPGTGGALDMGLQTVAGLYTVVASDNVTHCNVNMTGSTVITLSPLPTVFNVTGGGDYCSGGSGVHIGLSGSTPGISYQLLKGGVPVTGGLLAGTGSILDFGAQTAAGSYSVVATNVISSCTGNMSGSVTININPVPVDEMVTGGGGYCAGTGGKLVGLGNSVPGIDYQLYHSGVATGLLVTGIGAAIDFGLQTLAGVYTVVATNAATGCNKTLTTSVAVNVIALPSAYTVTSGGRYCAGGAGEHIYLSGSHSGVNYQLYNGITVMGSPVSGSGTGLDFGLQTNAGSYTVVAVDATTGCTNNMTSGSSIAIDALPAAFAIGGGGHYCAGGAGVALSLAGSEAGVNYQLYVGGTASGLPVGGTGIALNFGLRTDIGTYTITATNNTTGCKNAMIGAETVTADPMVTPAVSITSSIGTTSCIGISGIFTATPANGGASPSYVWNVNGLFMATGSTLSYIPSNGDLIAVTLTSDAVCATATTATNLLTMTTLPYQLPSVTVAATPGNNVCQGTPVTFTATPNLAGSTPGLLWFKNGAVVGAGATFGYTPTSANDGDVIEFMLKSSYQCPLQDTVFSDPIAISVDAARPPVFTLSNHLGPKVGVGQVDTFYATVVPVSGSAFSYQWMVQNTPVSGATSSMYIDYSVFNGDNISCVVTREGACGDQSLSQSTTVHLSDVGVQPVVTSAGNLTVLPNPNSGAFTIKGSLGTAADQEVSIQMTDMLGQAIYKSKIVAHNGNVDEHIQLDKSIANGMYLLDIRSGTTNSVYHVVVEQ